MSAPSPTPFPRLRRLSLHLWAYWTSLMSEAAFLVRLSKSRSSSERVAAVEALVRTKLDVGNALDQGQPAGRIGVLRSIGLNLRSFHCDRIVGLLLGLPVDLRAAIRLDDLKRILHFAELSLAYCEAGTERAFAKPRTAASRIRALQRLSLNRALHHAVLAAAYVRLEVGDPSQNLEAAFEHYRRAATILAQEPALALSLYAANVWRTLASAELSYPTEHRAQSARQAIEAFSAAKAIVAPRAATLEAPPEIMTDRTAWERLPYPTRARYAARYVLRLQRSRWKAGRTGAREPLLSGVMTPFFAAKVDWQLGIAYRELGQLEQAVEHFTLAVGEFAEGGEYFRAGVETDIGYAYLEAKAGDPRKNLTLAAESFQNAMAASSLNGFVKNGFEKTYALALVGDARVYFEQESLGTITSEQRAKSCPMLVGELRTAARIARKIPARPLLSEALFLLGKAYGLQGNTAKQYCALALAARVGDSLAARARTPRLSRYLVGMQAPLYDLLTVTAFERGFSQPKDPGLKAKTGAELHRVFSFAERGRTVFLRTHLASMEVLPRGAPREDLRGFFAQRRIWHEAEIRLLEYESARRADDTALRELTEHRDRCASRYRAELAQVRAKFNDAAYDPDKWVMGVRFADLYPPLSNYLKTERAALVEYCLTSRGLLVFVWLPTKLTATYVGISVAELKRIEARWREGSAVLRETNNVAYWEGGYLGQVLDRLRRAVEVPAQTIRGWEAETGRRVERVMIVPHRFLHHVPLHAIILDGTPWGDSVVIHYVPSASLLLQLLRARDGRQGEPVLRPDRRERRAAVSIGYPGEPPLLFCCAEAQAVAAATGGQVLLGQGATPARVKDAIRDAAYIHFSCHGVYNSEIPLDAGLMLAPDTLIPEVAPEFPREPQRGIGPARPEGGRLTLGEILRDVGLPRARLVVLSACETGLTKVEERHEEYLGLPAGFLYAGATTVLSSLWKVNDIATWLLMRAFVRELAAGAATWVALRKAQQELRGLSGEYVMQQVERAAEQEDDPVRREAMRRAGRGLRQAGPFPFARPYWWAGFTVNGL